ncbi:MAG: hypothetical protein AAGN46_14900 [Acidobacteriota bacterium]
MTPRAWLAASVMALGCGPLASAPVDPEPSLPSPDHQARFAAAPGTEDRPSETLPDAEAAAARRLAAADRAAHTAFPKALEARTAAALPADASGLLGRNQRWGEMFSPRFQLGAGAALRIALAAERRDAAQRAFRAVEVATEAIDDDGAVSSRVPDTVSGGAQPNVTDLASGAAFFLGDACLGAVALEADVERDRVSSQARRQEVRSRLAAAARWLADRHDLLERADRKAPNRLLYDALAFRGGALLVDDAVERRRLDNLADAFTRRALDLQRADGVFVEAGGHDTSYQAVALAVGEDLLLVSRADDPSTDRLASSLERAASWLAGRVGPDGRVDSTGNRRTCAGGESFLGEPKRLDLVKVFSGLVATGVRTGSAASDAARRIERWVGENRGRDPCFP